MSDIDDILDNTIAAALLKEAENAEYYRNYRQVNFFKERPNMGQFHSVFRFLKNQNESVFHNNTE